MLGELKDPIKKSEPEIFKDAGMRNFEDSASLLKRELVAIQAEKTTGILGIKKIGEISLSEGEKISEGAITYQRIGNYSKLIFMSDLHGCRDDLDSGVTEYLNDKKDGQETYFTFLGDVGTGKPQKLEINEILADLKNEFSHDVNINSGNGDRRSCSLFNGLQMEIVEKFAPELYKLLNKRTCEILKRLYKEKNMSDEDAEKKLIEKKFDYNSVFAAQFLRAAREAGAEPLEIKDLDVLYNVMRTASGFKRADQKDRSNVFTMGVLRHMVDAINPVNEKRDTKDRKDGIIKDENMSAQALKMFDYWKTQNEIYNQQPVITIYETQDTVIICSHSGFVKEVNGLDDLVDNVEFQTKAVWNQYMKDEVTAFGDYDIYDKEKLGKYLGKIVPPGKNIIYMTGHNHGNKIEEIEILDNAGKNMGNKALRVEVCSGEIKNPDPKFVVLNLSKVTISNLNEAVQFKSTK